MDVTKCLLTPLRPGVTAVSEIPDVETCGTSMCHSGEICVVAAIRCSTSSAIHATVFRLAGNTQHFGPSHKPPDSPKGCIGEPTHRHGDVDLIA